MKPTAIPKFESAHDILHRRKHPLDVFFSPEAVAVIGATENPGRRPYHVLEPDQ